MTMYQTANTNLQQIADSGQCFRMHRLAENSYSVIAQGKYLELVQFGNAISLSCPEDDEDIWRDYFDSDTDYANMIDHAPSDSYLQKCIEFGSGIRILNQELFECIISFIISQQKNIAQIQKCVEHIAKEFGKPIPGPKVADHVGTVYAFPSAEDMKGITVADLKGFNLGYRDEYICDAVQWYLNEYPKIENLEEFKRNYVFAKSQLKSIRGVGDKVANCICLFALHQFEACPIDVHMQRIIDTQYQGIAPTWMSSPYAGVYQQYCFYYSRNHS